MAGTYKDPIVRLNDALPEDGHWRYISVEYTDIRMIPANETYKIGNETITLPLKAFCISNITSTDDIITMNEVPLTKRYIDSTQYKREKLAEIRKVYKRVAKNYNPNFNIDKSNDILKKKGIAQAKIVPLVRGYPDTDMELLYFTPDKDIFLFSFQKTTLVSAIRTWGPTDILKFEAGLDKIVQYGKSNNLNNLIIDLTFNGGGYLSIMQRVLIMLIAEWENGESSGTSNPFFLVDFRKSSLTDEVLNKNTDLFRQQDIINPISNEFYTDQSWYTNGPTLIRGGSSSKYTKQAYFNTVPDVTPSSFYFDKILIITDGSCGSACSHFVSKLQTEKKASVLTIGGKIGVPMDISSFNGGNVLEWSGSNSFVDILSGITLANKPSNLPYNSRLRFNFREAYVNSTTVPREFLRFEADFHLYDWDIVYTKYRNFYEDNETRSAVANLYATANSLFPQIQGYSLFPFNK